MGSSHVSGAEVRFLVWLVIKTRPIVDTRRAGRNTFGQATFHVETPLQFAAA
jgi:hypothetical protein